VCTTVIVVVISVDSHFHCFHAFLLTIVPDVRGKERQFLARLRLRLEEPLAAGTDRQSLLFVGWHRPAKPPVSSERFGDPQAFGVRVASEASA
jgi:hypothetical protein